MAKVKVTVRFRDMANNGIWREVGHEIECDKERAKVIVEHGFGKLIEEAIEPVEKAVKEVKKEKAVKEKATKEVKPEKKATKKKEDENWCKELFEYPEYSKFVVKEVLVNV